ncbi:MAG: hypothetical protein JRF50_16665 [Deltaproteobacteria bacterium]|nr:hypothetical protein [Deltaproteobacteria bacterium]
MEKQIGVKVRAGRQNPNPDPGRVKKRPLRMGGIVTAASYDPVGRYCGMEADSTPGFGSPDRG